jgi:hypothetical protein
MTVANNWGVGNVHEVVGLGKQRRGLRGVNQRLESPYG